MLDMEVFEKIPREGSISAKDLAVAAEVDEQLLSTMSGLNKLAISQLKQRSPLMCHSSLLVRLMRLITTTKIINEVVENVYEHTRFSLAYLDGTEVDFYKLMYVSRGQGCSTGQAISDVN